MKFATQNVGTSKTYMTDIHSKHKKFYLLLLFYEVYCKNKYGRIFQNLWSILF